MWSQIVGKSGWIWPQFTLKKKCSQKVPKRAICHESLSVFFNLSLLFCPKDRHQSVSTRIFSLKISNIFYIQKWGVKTVSLWPWACGGSGGRRKRLLDGAVDLLSKIWQHITTASFVSAFIFVLTWKPSAAFNLV